MKNQTRYMINFEDDMEEPIIIIILENVDRPNCPEDEEIIKKHIEDEYVCTEYNAVRIDDLKTIVFD